MAHDYEQDRGEHETKIVTGTDSHSMETSAASAEIADENICGKDWLMAGQGVGVVGVAAHDVAVLVGVEVAGSAASAGVRTCRRGSSSRVPCSTVTMSHCHSQLQKVPAA